MSAERPFDLDPFREYCEFGEDRVYLLLAIARDKNDERADDEDTPTMRRVVEDAEDLERSADRLAHAASRYDSRYRLYLTVNARDTVAAFFALRERMDGWLRARLAGDEGVRRKFGRVDREFLSVLQSDGSRADRYFLFDVDDADPDERDRLRGALEAETTVSLDRETPNGYHLVTAPFDYTAFDAPVAYELKTDGLVFVSAP